MAPAVSAFSLTIIYGKGGQTATGDEGYHGVGLTDASLVCPAEPLQFLCGPLFTCSYVQEKQWRRTSLSGSQIKKVHVFNESQAAEVSGSLRGLSLFLLYR